ncbi:hypothetical protein D9756_001552 [Leucocoprinus leucothites]|uniref:Phorbol-ester/DAG-type domain-containing protein n=1 Tax=Leucocoprinus leucothites TaxID=201217 RepID=A0A8H5LI31_9AGAR|nr:hypothetical protein D9756_001552 [Leucoagaricus leucothites]
MSFGRPPLPRIETEQPSSPLQDLRFSLDTTSPFTPVTSQVPGFPSFRLSVSTNDENPQDQVLEGLKPVKNRARDEGRKLLALVLTQLRDRLMPPSVSDAVGTLPDENNHGWTFRNAVKAQLGKLDRGQLASEDSDDDGQDYSTDATFKLMVQLQEILVTSLEQRWDIFNDSGLADKPVLSSDDDNRPSISPFRRSRTSFNSGGRKSRSPSPSRRNQVFASELLTLCISVLASVITEDCRFQTNSPRPFCPPNALQALTLNVAQVLLHINTSDPRTVSQIGLALIPAFSSFSREMYPRLISFFNQGIIRNSLSDLRRLQGVVVKQSMIESSVDHPIVSIHVVEEPEVKSQDNQNPLWVPWTSAGKTLKVQSTNAPAQPMPIYYLSSLIPPLLGCALDNIDLETLDEKGIVSIQFLQDLFQTIIDLKVDAYLDLLQVISYHTPKARKFAAFLLASCWPQSVGHVLISQPPNSDLFHFPQFFDKEFERHQFFPWYFLHRHNWFSPGDSSQHDCSVCRKAIHGFGLLCPYCTCAVHFDCYDYPGGSTVVQYANASDPHVQRVAMFRFSYILSPPTNLQGAIVVNGRHHQFQRINLFTLSLCSTCQQPLWGCTSQAFLCTTCSLVVHPHCLDVATPQSCGLTAVDSNTLTISFSELRTSCFEHYRDILVLTREQLAEKSYEEISVFRDILSTQLQILNQGLLLGTLLVAHKGKSAETGRLGTKEFKLHHTIKWCEDLLGSDCLYASPVMEEYLQENDLLRRDHSMLYTWSSLVYVAASMKSPSTALGLSNSASSDFLNVTQAELHPEHPMEEVPHPFDMVSLSHMRDVLGHELRIYSDAAAFGLLSHLHQLAFFSLKGEGTFSDLQTMQKNKNESCSFPLPLGLDLSIDVETLVSAIEACLSDVDLYVNEFGFLLLTRRMWPDGLMSDYALKRLARSVFTWIINEENHLALILRDYLGKNRPLPGLASNLLDQWPPIYHERPLHNKSLQNSGDYLASRQALLNRYARRWSLALHNQDVNLYGGSVFETCDELADHAEGMTTWSLGNQLATEKSRSVHCERVLHHILQLSQARVLFSVSDNIYLRWLELAHTYGILEKNATSSTLLRLFPRDSDYRATSTLIISASGEQVERSAGLETDPWQVIVNVTRSSQSNIDTGLSWLNLLSRSGIEVPLDIYTHFISGLGAIQNPLKGVNLFIETMLASLWLRPHGRHRYQRLLADFHLSLLPALHRALNEPGERQVVFMIIRNTLASCLLLYGCERSYLLSTGLVEEQLVANLPSRRKIAKEAVSVDPVTIDPAILKSIEEHLKVRMDDVTRMLAQFMHAFFTSSSYIESHEMDNFILRNETILSRWQVAWRFYDVQVPEVAKIRTLVLLRVLSVAPEGFQDILEQRFSHTQGWERRVRSATRLFRVVQDVCNPGFDIDGRQWKSSIVEVFQSFFSLLWSDPKEEIRLIAKSHCSSLLPAHFEALTSCFDETMTRAPFIDRVRLILFLTRLRVHFPRWQVLSWKAILEVFAEHSEHHQNVFVDSGGVRNNDLVAESDPELARLNVSLVTLTLDMLSDGVNADGLTLIKIKAQLVRIFGFQNVSMVPAGANGRAFHLAYGEVSFIPELAYPCIGSLISVLDSYHKVELPTPTITTILHDDEKEVEVLIGTAFADIPLSILATYDGILLLPVLVIKHLLEAVHVIVYKHDFESRTLSVFSGQAFRKAIIKILDLLEADIPHEVRQVAFSTIQAFFKRATTLTSSLILSTVEKVLGLQPTRPDQLSQDSLVEQGCLFVGDVFEKYCKSGLFINLLKRPLKKKFFFALKHALSCPKDSTSTLKDDLLWDTLMRLQETEIMSSQDFLSNLQTFVDVIHHEHYNADTMSLFGKQLASCAQRMSDGSGTSVDASPLFMIPAILLRHNKATSKDLLLYLDTLVRIVLTRLQVDSKSLSQLLVTTVGLRRKNQPQDPTSIVNTITPTVLEILSDGLRLKTRLQANTLQSILEALVEAQISPGVTPVTLHSQSFVDLVEGGSYWLDHYLWAEGQTEKDFYASLAVARMIFQAMSYDASVLQRISDGTERHGRPQLRSMRAWNVLAIAALSDGAETFWATQLFKQLKAFSATYFNVLSSHLKAGGLILDTASGDINQVDVAIKLWLMIARKSQDSCRYGEPVYDLVWNELWPPFGNIVNALEVEAQTGVSPVMAGFIATSISDLFLFIRTLRIPLSLQKSAQKTMLKRLQSLVRGDSNLAKASPLISRAIEGLAETPPEVPLETLVDRAAKVIVATEKIRLLESKREPVRLAGDRRVNVEKKATVDRLNWK